MNGHTIQLDDPAHEAARALLPWYAADRLDATDSAAVRRHLANCAACRAELDFERHVQAAAALPDDGADARANANVGLAAGLDVERALAALMPRLDPVVSVPVSAPVSESAPALAPIPAPALAPAHAPAAAPAPAPAPARPWWRRAAANDSSWLRWAVAAQFMVIAGLGLLLARPAAEQGTYHVLGAGAAAGNLVVVFKPETAERDMRRILQANGAHVVDGPTVTDAYLLSVPDPRAARARLRAEPAVALAETLDGGALP
ncbi:zf-HC2 domain-containing protein [Duganella sp. LX20W]|uniref:Zf-HC2 domain-containing protein n=1 Tax=Rugamonas brunnea TaxID=2758569 RepID=A0A7W2ESX3_9BURK|nr:zf-HC2 domain-containing protein [Rugamonas brunnea]MBA5638035.1 zf-HC2 domain-containing protein [Rugamonas brunnea]